MRDHGLYFVLCRNWKLSSFYLFSARLVPDIQFMSLLLGCLGRAGLTPSFFFDSLASIAILIAQG